MRCIRVLLLTLLCSTTPALAQRLEDVAVGSRIRLTLRRAPGTAEGSWLGLQRDTASLYLVGAIRDTLIGLADVRRADLFVGMRGGARPRSRFRKAHLVRGLTAAGSFAGVMTLLMLVSGNTPDARLILGPAAMLGAGVTVLEATRDLRRLPPEEDEWRRVQLPPRAP
jgi:hypothetical protein